MTDGAQSQWLQGSFTWDPASLTAQPAKGSGSKKAGGAPLCQVEGCGADLSSLRFFFRKQRICERHARADVVTDSSGRQLRFCQQCTRLELLSNFNSGRRSCKASLAKRQARAHRGKASFSPDSSPERGARGHRRMASSSSEGEVDGSASLKASSGKGSSRRSSGAAPCSKRSRGSPAGSGGASPAVPAMNSNGSTGPAASSLAYNAWVAGHQAAILPTTQQPSQLVPPALAQPAGEEMLWSSGMFQHDIEDLLALDPDALADALMVQPCMAMPSSELQQDGSGSTATHQLQMSSTGASTPSAVQHALPSAPIWGLQAGGAAPAQAQAAAPQLFTAAPAAPIMGGVPCMVPTVSAGCWPGAASTGAAAAIAPLGPADMAAQARSLQSLQLQSHPQVQPLQQLAWASQPEALQVAAMQQQASGVAAAVQQMYPEQVIARFSFKIFGVNPDHLPPQMRAELLTALQVSPTVMEGAIRSGCTQLVVDVLLSSEEARQLATAPRLTSAVQHLRRPDCWHGRQGPPAMVAQAGQLVALGTAASGAQDGPLPCIHMGSSQLLPRLALAGPLVTTAGAAGGSFLLAAAATSTDGAGSGARLAAALRCRRHGQHVALAVSVLRRGGGPESGEDCPEQGEGDGEGEAMPPPRGIQLPQPLEPGAVVLEAWAPGAASEEGPALYEFELSSGSLLSPAVPVLVLPDAHADAAAELCQLQQQQSCGPENLQHASPARVVRLVAAVLRYLQYRRAAGAAGPGMAAEAAFQAAYPLLAAVKLATVARHLVALAVRARWPAVARLLLPAVTADSSSAEAAVRQLDALAAPAPSIAHLAIASGAAATLGALRSWAVSEGASLEISAAGAAVQQAAAPAMSPLLLAAGMGASLDEPMVQQVAELLGPERFAAAADEPGPSGWTPRQVAAATGNTALLSALPPQPAPQREPAVVDEAPPAVPLPAAEVGGKAEDQLLRHQSLKLQSLQQDWPDSYQAVAYEPVSCGGGKAAASGAPSKAHAAPQGVLAGKTVQPLPSHDAPLLASLLHEMEGPPQQGRGIGASAAGAPSHARSTTRATQRLATSVVGAAAVVVAALASLAVRMAS